MFCPNCGTENEEAATTCKKCGFNLKSAAAPKFKGTMLMMNSPMMPKAAPAAPVGGSGAVPPPPAAPLPVAPRPQLKGTMLGVAPPSLGAQSPPQQPLGPPPGPQGFGPPPGGATIALGSPVAVTAPGYGPPPAGPAPGYGPSAAPGYGPPGAPGVAQPPVNPLGGTMVADVGMGFNPYAQPGAYGPPPGTPANPYGAPEYGTPGQPGQPYGTPGQPGQPYGTPGQPGQPYGTPGQPGYADPAQPPQPAYGGPPGAGYGAPGGPQGGFGPTAQAPPGFGPPPAGSYNAPAGYGGPGAFTPAQETYGMPGGSAPLVPMGGQPGPVGKMRNPVLTIALSYVTCGFYGLFAAWGMLNELKAFRGKDDLNPILFFIPILGIIEFLKLGEKVLDAKRMAGVPGAAVVSPILYLLFGLFYLPSDLNEVWQAASGGQLRPV